MDPRMPCYQRGIWCISVDPDRCSKRQLRQLVMVMVIKKRVTHSQRSCVLRPFPWTLRTIAKAAAGAAPPRRGVTLIERVLTLARLSLTD